LAAATRALNVADRLSAVGSTLRRLNPAGIVAGARRLLGGSADNVAGSLDEIGDIERTLRGALNNQVFDPEAFARTLSRLTPEQMQQIQNTLAARLDDLPQSIRQQAQAQIARTQAAYPGAQGLRMSLEPVQVDVPLDQVRYSQAWVSRATRDGTPISEIAENMRVRGWDRTKDPALMVQFEDGRIVTLDHRRLVAANQAGLRDVPALLHPERMPISADQAGRFRLRVEFTYNGRIYRPGALPTNWGEAAMFRSANQRIDVPQFPIEGNPVVPIIGRPRR
jgi:ParB-like chromosome segregation protein Spo0J